MILKPNLLDLHPNFTRIKIKPTILILRGIILLSAFLLSGCLSVSTVKLPDPAFISDDIIIIDKRTDYDKAYSRDFYDIKLGDKNYRPNILDILNSKFKENKPTNLSKIYINLWYFSSTIHNNVRTEDMLMGALSPIFFGFPDNLISCKIQGTINDQALYAEESVSYRPDIFAHSIIHDKKAVEAIDNCISHLVLKSYKILSK
jgi:hypothetical protein